MQTANRYHNVFSLLPFSCLLLSKIAVFLLLPVSLVFAQATTPELKLALKPTLNKPYHFSVREKIQTQIVSHDHAHSKENTRQETITFTAIDRQDDLLLADINGEGWQRRRYLYSNGAVAGSPGEDSTELPLFLTFPSGPLHQGQKHVQKGSLSLRGKQYPILRELTVEKIDPQRQTVLCQLDSSVQLPLTKGLNRTLAMTGTLVYDTRTGMPRQGTLTTSYSLSVTNKEFAVIRPLWQYTETRTISIEEGKDAQ